jgi:hypothetical protein
VGKKNTSALQAVPEIKAVTFLKLPLIIILIKHSPGRRHLAHWLMTSEFGMMKKKRF